jgi:SAM-dependent methyltransferase
VADRAVAREVWEQVHDAFTGDDGRVRWHDEELGWGLFRIPESTVGALGDVAGLDVAELGCGTAYLSAQLARLGARPVALDLSPDQLRSAAAARAETGLAVALVEASADELPFGDRTFDLVVSEYGAAPWCDPTRWLPEAARILRPGGRLVFLTNSVLAAMCVPDEGGYAGNRLLRPQRSVREVAWPGGGVEHHPGHGEWIGHLRSEGFEVEALHELHPPDDAVTPEWYEIVTAGWATRWPAEDLWIARVR